MTYSYKAAFNSIDEFSNHDSADLALFALTIKYNIDDLPTLAAESLTDKGNDKKIDAIFIDEEELGCAIIIQAYKSTTERDNDEAPANKADDLNTAVSWAFNQPFQEIPESIKSNIGTLRDGIHNGRINHIEFWYVHNLKESKNVSAALKAVERSAEAALKRNFADCSVSVGAMEVGNNILENWYRALSNPIIVSDAFEIDITEGGYKIEKDGLNWKAYVTKVNAGWLQDKFVRYGTDLFSANIRGYLGSRKSDKNINNRIIETCKTEPDNFWIYNNGITCLVNKFNPDNGKLKIEGLTIVNGAQTTGAIGSVGTIDLNNAWVPARFVVCHDHKTLEDMIRYNNSQNSISAADFRSNDQIQKRLRKEFEEIPNATYKGRRGGIDDVIRRPPNLIPSDTVAQALAVMNANPILAYNAKTEIWEDNRYYAKYFNEHTTAKHVVFAYSLIRSLEQKKKELRQNESSLTASQKEQLLFLRHRGAILLLASAISESLETFLNRQLPNKTRLSYGLVSPDTAISYWTPIIDATIPFANQLVPALQNGLNNQEKVQKAISNFKSLVEATSTANRIIFTEFSQHVSET